MLSLDKCNKILNKKEKKYTQNQVSEIRDLLYQLAEIIYESKPSSNEEFGEQTGNTIPKG